MSIIKKTYNLIVKSIQRDYRCIKCNRTEKQLVGDTSKSDGGHSIFSPENLCIDCEIRTYPDRFHGCGFCKRPIREKFSCMICSSGFVEWVRNVIQPIDSLSMIIRQSAGGLLDRSIHDLPIEHHKFIVRNDDGYYKWPGFYAGITNKFSAKNSTQEDPDANVVESKTKKKETKITDKYDDLLNGSDPRDENSNSNASMNIDLCFDEKTDQEQKDLSHGIVKLSSSASQSNCFPVWIIPKLTNGYDVNFSDLRLDLKIFQQILLGILEKNNINLYEDVQIDLDKMDNLQIKTVNPYDTRVMKRFI